jgi:hypothetical protein
MATNTHGRWWLRRILGVVAVLAIAGVVFERLTVMAHAAPTDFDDAYTYLRYAQHWLDGYGVVWNVGERPIFGVTSLLHLSVVTAIRWALAELDLWRVLQLASGAAAVGALAASIAGAALSCRHPRLSRNWILWSAVLVPAITFREAFTFHAGTGMDTMLSMLANAGLVFASLRLARRPSVGPMLVALVAGAATVVARPDNLLCAVLCPALAIAWLAPSPRTRPLLAYAIACVTMLGLLAVAAWTWLGSPVPLSFFVKQPGYYRGFAGEFGWDPFRFLGVFLQSAWPFILAVVLFADRRSVRRLTVLLAPALLTVGLLFRFNQIMGHLGRFYYPLLPFFVAAGVLEFDAWLSRGRTDGWLRSILLRVPVAIGLVLVVRLALDAGAERYTARMEEQTVPSVAGYRVHTTAALPELDSWESAKRISLIAAAAPVGARFAMSEHGLPGAAAPRIAIIDVLGLHDSAFAAHGFSVSELFRRQPDVIWMPHDDHAEMLREIFASDELWSHYDVYPEAFFHGLAVRRDGPHAAALTALVADVWRASYPGTTPENHRADRGE